MFTNILTPKANVISQNAWSSTDGIGVSIRNLGTTLGRQESCWNYRSGNIMKEVSRLERTYASLVIMTFVESTIENILEMR